MKGKNKIRTIITGVALLAVLILTGTYAWTQFNQGAFAPAWDDWNVFGGQYGGRMHHDFEDRDGAGNYDSDIYAENFGEENLFVRVQLREFYSVNGVAIDGAVVNDPTTWPIYRSMPNDVNLRYTGGGVYEIGEEGVITTLGDTTGNKVFMPTFNHATIPTDDIDPAVPNPFNIREAYRFTTTTGRAVDAIAYLFTISSVTGAPDVYSNGVQTGPAVANGTHAFWNVGDTYDGNLIYIDEVTGFLSTRPETHTARTTISPDYGGIMTWTQWDEDGRPSGNFWIHDDTDPNGWFYWNGNLPAGEATSLLMRDVYLPDRPEAWEYIVTLNADFFTHDSINDLYPVITDNAELIFLESGLYLPAAMNQCLQDGNPHNVWTDSTGFQWCVVADEGDYSMLVARHTIDMIELGINHSDVPTIANNNSVHSVHTHVTWPESTQTELPPLAGTHPGYGPEARVRIHEWWNMNSQVSQELRNSAVDALIPRSDSTEDFASGETTPRATNDAHLSSPIPGSLGAQNPLFFLSEAEIYQWMGQTTNVSRVTRRINATFDVSPRLSAYFLRSNGITTGATPASAAVSSTGAWGVNNNHIQENHTFRPAVWVRRGGTLPPPPIPAAIMGCPQSGTSSNIWSDSTGFQWCVIAEDGDYSMLVARHALQMEGVDGIPDNRLHNSPVYVAWPDTTDHPLPPTLSGTYQGYGPEGRIRLHTWWNSTDVSQELRLRAVDAEIPVTYTVPTANDVRGIDTTALSSPIPFTNNAEMPVFILSEAEYNVLLGGPNAANRVNGVFGTDHHGASNWLRGMGAFTNHSSAMRSDSVWHSLYPNSTLPSAGFRPAVWVQR